MRFQIRISAGFILLVAIIIFLGEEYTIFAAIPAIAVHEAGHAAAMLFYGVRPVRLTFSAAGLCLDYSDELFGRREATAALAGPAAGAVFALACAYLGSRLESRYLFCCAGIGLILSIVNLFPALPLDGGRALAALLGEGRRAKRTVGAVSAAFSLALTGAGLFYALRGEGFALLFFGLFLTAAQINETCKQGRERV